MHCFIRKRGSRAVYRRRFFSFVSLATLALVGCERKPPPNSPLPDQSPTPSPTPLETSPAPALTPSASAPSSSISVASAPGFTPTPAPTLTSDPTPTPDPADHPLFKNPAANEFVESYDAFIADFKAAYSAMKKRDMTKYETVILRAQDLQNRGEKLATELTSDEQKLFAQYLDHRANELAELTKSPPSPNN